MLTSDGENKNIWYKSLIAWVVFTLQEADAQFIEFQRLAELEVAFRSFEFALHGKYQILREIINTGMYNSWSFPWMGRVAHAKHCFNLSS